MGTCVAFGCINKPAKKIKGITFHRFPSEQKQRTAWINAVRRENWQPSKYSTLCSEHFEEKQIDRTSLSYVRLRENAVPTVFKSYPSYLQKVQSSVADWDQESDEESEFDISAEQRLDGSIKIEFTDDHSNEDMPAPVTNSPPDVADKASSSSSSCVAFPPVSPAKPGLKRKNNNSEGVLMTSKRPCISQYQDDEDEFDAVGKNVAAKLKALSKTFPAQRIIAEKIIADTLYHAQFNALTTKSCISNTSNISEMDWLSK